MLRNSTQSLTHPSPEAVQLRMQLSEARARIVELERLADTDPLTELPNRRPFMRAIGRVLRQFDRHKTPAAVMFVDVDGLKTINDRFGHQGGDNALLHIAEVLQRELRGSDVVARIGGDEFGLVLDHLDETAARAKALALAAAVSAEPVRVGGASTHVRLSVGVASARDHDSVESVLSRADEDMYAMKRG